jgi:hypothetical protein
MQIAEMGGDKAFNIVREGSIDPKPTQAEKSALATIYTRTAAIVGEENVRHESGVAIAELGGVSIPGNEKTGRDNGVVRLYICPKGSIMPRHIAMANRMYGLNPKGDVRGAYMQALAGKIGLFFEDGSWRCRHFGVTEPVVLAPGDYAHHPVQGSNLICIEVLPYGEDSFPFPFKDDAALFKNSGELSV